MLFFIIGIIIIISGFALILNTSKSKKRKKVVALYNDSIVEITKMFNKISEELERTKEISKNEEGKELYNNWCEENKYCTTLYQEIQAKVLELNEFITNREFKEFSIVSNEVEGGIYELGETVEQLLHKIKTYTSFALENTRISLKIKTSVKNSTNKFDKKLNYLGNYNNSFLSEITQANNKIDEFEALQRKGNYPDGRLVLKECLAIVDGLDKTMQILIKFHENLGYLNDDIELINKIKYEIENIGYKINISEFDSKIAEYKNQHNSIITKILDIDFGYDTSDEMTEQLKEELNVLDEHITTFKNIVEEKFNFIKDIMHYTESNEGLLKTADEIIMQANEERLEIIKLYQIDDFKQMKHFDVTVKEYEKFKEDFSILKDIISNAKEDYSKIKVRVIQSNKYLIRVLRDAKSAVKELKAIRTDELQVRDKLSEYKVELVNIDLYLRKYNHLTFMSADLNNKYYETIEKCKELEELLECEPLDISRVRLFSKLVDENIQSLIKEDVVKNIKQKIGSELLIRYLNRYRTSDKNNVLVKRINNLYAQNEYKKVLSESLHLLKEFTDNGEKKYREIVSKVEIDGYTRVTS